MRIKTANGSIVNVNKTKRSITIEGIEFGSDCRALVSKHRDGTGTITLVFDGKVIKKFNRLRNITWHRKEVNDAFLS